ncbi:hypothetical protein TNCT_448971 [Trichonephila clavata]|uniref:Uncharacterized protein n=1 Tax=Trichonephila clavata TaxID=2740835 RepID=A0A8X6J023_TRICU|nr:hypothetical protein TNCT_448971 [Trichonephila clavata]
MHSSHQGTLAQSKHCYPLISAMMISLSFGPPTLHPRILFSLPLPYLIKIPRTPGSIGSRSTAHAPELRPCLSPVCIRESIWAYKSGKKAGGMAR